MGSIEDIKSTIKQGLSYLDKKDYEQAQKYIDKAYELSRNSNYVSGISISLSLSAFINYSLGNEKGVSVADDGAFMAQKSDDFIPNLM